MDLQEAQRTAWSQHPNPPGTTLEVMARLQRFVEQGVIAFESGDLPQSQVSLEDAMIQLLLGFQMMDVDPQRAFERGLKRLSEVGGARPVFHVFGDHVEVWLDEQCRGQWPLYSQHDYESALQVAYSLGCEVVHDDSQQLGLFALAGRS